MVARLTLSTNGIKHSTALYVIHSRQPRPCVYVYSDRFIARGPTILFQSFVEMLKVCFY